MAKTANFSSTIIRQTANQLLGFRQENITKYLRNKNLTGAIIKALENSHIDVSYEFCRDSYKVEDSTAFAHIIIMGEDMKVVDINAEMAFNKKHSLIGKAEIAHNRYTTIDAAQFDLMRRQ